MPKNKKQMLSELDAISMQFIQDSKEIRGKISEAEKNPIDVKQGVLLVNTQASMASDAIGGILILLRDIIDQKQE